MPNAAATPRRQKAEVNRVNRNGDRTVPWAVPVVLVNTSDERPFATTKRGLPVSTSEIQVSQVLAHVHPSERISLLQWLRKRFNPVVLCGFSMCKYPLWNIDQGISHTINSKCAITYICRGAMQLINQSLVCYSNERKFSYARKNWQQIPPFCHVFISVHPHFLIYFLFYYFFILLLLYANLVGGAEVKMMQDWLLPFSL